MNAIVTGGGSGIGKGLVLELAKKGVNVAVTDINTESLEKVSGELSNYSVKNRIYKVDHSNLIKVQEFKEKYFQDFNEIDILCLNAGIFLGGNILNLTLEKWENVMNINFWGVVYMLNLFLPQMIKREKGFILITASAAGLFGIPGMTSYCASKFALVGMAESLRIELANKNIKITTLCPGIVNTNIIKSGDISFDKNKIEAFAEKLGVSPEKVARDGIRALEKNKDIIITPFITKVPYFIKKLSKQLYNYFVGTGWNRNFF